MPITETAAGKVQGTEREGVLQFRGIKYATASRFSAPQPVEPWSDVYDATAFGPILPQNPSGLETMLGKSEETPMHEDALLLNVFTPALDDRARPVMLWIHGGAFTAGAGSIPWYSGANLARGGDVVVVTINYRLGVFGFLHLDNLLGTGFEGSGNTGIRDQVAAISWVRDNIASFGGDPGNITLFGESAGGMSIATLLAVPGVPAMIRNAIPQSGAGEAVKSTDDAQRVTDAVLAELGLGTAGAEALLELPVDQLLGAQTAASTKLASDGALRMPFAPVVDGVVLHDNPTQAVHGGAAADVHLLIGTTADEYKLFSVLDRARGALPDNVLAQRVEHIVGRERAADALAVYRDEHPGASNDDLWSHIATDWIFRIPAIRLAEAQSAHQADTYSYLFTYQSTAFDGALGACHAIDVPFTFGNLDRRGVNFLLGDITDDTRALERATAQAWLAMARDGAPGHEELSDWPRYSSDNRAVMELGLERRVLDDPGSGPRQFWASLTG
jgi:para-nitrobenzyl esterase